MSHIQLELFRQMCAQRADTAAFGGMVAGCDKGYTGFPRGMCDELGRLAGHKTINIQRSGFMEKTLRPASTPADAT